MKRIIFVDDEASILAGLRRSLRCYADRWEMAFVGSGAEALNCLEQSAFDVIVTDMRMPEMDGAQLLREVHKRFPAVTRIVLTGYSELAATLRAVPVAHQFLAKPCSSSVLINAIERACSLEALLRSPLLAQAAGEIISLPPCPETYLTLRRVIAVPETPISAIAKLIERDIAMSAKILQLVNSSFFGLRRRVVEIESAARYLGSNTLANLVLAVEAFKAIEGFRFPSGFSFDRLQRHAFLTAGIAQRLLDDKFLAEDAFMAGMLHDIGLLILASRMPERLDKAFSEACATGLPLHEVERRHLGVSHAEIGAYLLGMWGLPYPIIEAVAYHLAPRGVHHHQFGVVDAVHAACALAFELGVSEDLYPLRVSLDETFLNSLGVSPEMLMRWRGQAEEPGNAKADG